MPNPKIKSQRLGISTPLAFAPLWFDYAAEPGHQWSLKMRRQIATAVLAILVGLVALGSQAIAQQKTVAACRDEWRANKAANQANGITEKAYVAQCRGGESQRQDRPAA